MTCECEFCQADSHPRWDEAIVAAVAAERERCLKIAESNPGVCHECGGVDIADLIRSGATAQ